MLCVEGCTVNWEAIGAIGEIVGAIAVVVTLLFLIAQLRVNARAIQAQIRQSLSDNVQSRFENVTGDESFAEIMSRVRAGIRFEELTPVEQERYRFWAGAELGHISNHYYQFKLGSISKELWDERLNMFLTQLERVPALRDFWDISGSFNQDEFRAEVNKRLGSDA